MRNSDSDVTKQDSRYGIQGWDDKYIKDVEDSSNGKVIGTSGEDRTALGGKWRNVKLHNNDSNYDRSIVVLGRKIHACWSQRRGLL